MADSADVSMATLSAIDSERFGVRVARANLSPGCLPRVLDFCATEGIDFLIARCATGDLRAAQEIQEQGFVLMDTLVYYAFDLLRRKIPEDISPIPVRPFRPGDETQVRKISAHAFQGYMGHYHADRRLDPRLCDEAYASWAERSCLLRTATDAVFVADYDGEVVGFATLRLNSPLEGEGLLFAVAPAWQGRGICPSLMIRSLQWCLGHGAERMIISTQVTNVSMQKVWCRVRFEPSHSYYTFHKWFTPERPSDITEAKPVLAA
jgi:GNAT superfamily N-acetyltransferase